MKNPEEEILELRRLKYSCSQATLIGLSRSLDKPLADEALLKAAAGGLRGGIGRTFSEGTCGAVTGAVIALGLMCGDDENRAADISKELFNRFRNHFGTVRCGDIIDDKGHKRCNECCVFAGRCVAEMV